MLYKADTRAAATHCGRSTTQSPAATSPFPLSNRVRKTISNFHEKQSAAVAVNAATPVQPATDGDDLISLKYSPAARKNKKKGPKFAASGNRTERFKGAKNDREEVKFGEGGRALSALSLARWLETINWKAPRSASHSQRQSWLLVVRPLTKCPCIFPPPSLSFSDDIKKAVERPVTEVGKREIKGIRRNFTAAIKKKRKEAIQSSYRERDDCDWRKAQRERGGGGGCRDGYHCSREEKFRLYLTFPRGTVACMKMNVAT